MPDIGMDLKRRLGMPQHSSRIVSTRTYRTWVGVRIQIYFIQIRILPTVKKLAKKIGIFTLKTYKS